MIRHEPGIKNIILSPECGNRRNYCLTQTTPNVTNYGPMDPSDVGKSISCLFSGASLVLIFRLQELWKHVRGHSSKTRKIQEIFAIEKPERLRQWMIHGKLQTVDPDIARIFPGFPKFSVPQKGATDPWWPSFSLSKWPDSQGFPHMSHGQYSLYGWWSSHP